MSGGPGVRLLSAILFFVTEALLIRMSFPHVLQKESWDCGLACIEAIAERLGKSCELARALPDQSVWTIDLVLYLLERVSLPPRSVRFATTCAGVNPDLLTLSFYSSRLTLDAPRVTKEFERARSMGVDISVEALSLDHIQRKLTERRAVYLVLLDLRWMECKTCGSPLRALQFSFAGHYVVLHDYRQDDDTLVYMDPAASCSERPPITKLCADVSSFFPGSHADACCMSTRVFDIARQSKGTDQDIIEIKLRPD